MFIKIPNNFIYVSNKERLEDGSLPLIDGFGDKFIPALVYIHCNRNAITNKCKFSMEEIVEFLGYKPKTGKGKINEIVKKLLLSLENSKYISNCDISKAKISDTITCNLTIFDDVDSNFFQLYLKPIQKIMLSDYSNKVELLNTYCYMCARTYTRTADEQQAFDHNLTDCKAETFYDSYDAICSQLKISEATYNKVINILKDLELLFFDNIGSLFLNGKTKGNANNVYVLNAGELDLALTRSKFYYTSKGYIIKKKPSKSAKEEQGLKGKAKQEASKGKDTTVLDDKIKAIEDNKTKFEPKPTKVIEVRVPFGGFFKNIVDRDIDIKKEEMELLDVDNIIIT